MLKGLYGVNGVHQSVQSLVELADSQKQENALINITPQKN